MALTARQAPFLWLSRDQPTNHSLVTLWGPQILLPGSEDDQPHLGLISPTCLPPLLQSTKLSLLPPPLKLPLNYPIFVSFIQAEDAESGPQSLQPSSSACLPSYQAPTSVLLPDALQGQSQSNNPDQGVSPGFNQSEGSLPHWPRGPRPYRWR